MNQARSIYKTDFIPYDWMQNNFSSSTNDFCSPDNIDDCIQYISQEFCALGYPSIYLNSSSCPSAVNCDIVKLLNVTFELLGSAKDHVQINDDLECRNQRLSADVVSLNKKNSQLKENVELVERKYRSVLERERQLKEKNEKLTQAVKNEKNEAKKLSSQIQQQKIAYQHEIRKYESNTKQLKARLKQILADKNPDKKIASVSSSSLLQRNSKERGKWKSGTVAKSSMEEMYNSLISSYENRSQGMLKEITDYQHCLEYLDSEMQDLIFLLKGDEECNNMSYSKAVPLQSTWSEPNNLKELQDRFKYFLCELKQCVSEIKSNLEKSCEGVGENEVGIPVKEGIKKPSYTNQDSESQMDKLEFDKKELHDKQKELSATISIIEQEKSNLENQRLEIIKMAMQQDSAKYDWQRNLKSSPSFSVIVATDGLTAVPTVSQLKQCHSAPSQQVETLTPLWNMAHSESSCKLDSRPEVIPQPSSKRDTASSTPPEIQDVNFPTCDLPKWAATCLESDAKELNEPLSETMSNEELDTSNISLSEEQNLDRLKAAFDDMERRRNHPSF